MTDFQPTPFLDVNAVIRQVLDGARAILGSHFVGMYLDGSLAYGGFDEASDIDFVVVTDEEARGELFEQLKEFHARLNADENPWAVQLEGTYISKEALRRYDPALAVHPNLERGPGERLKLVEQGPEWDLHRYILRERGITIAGPEPETLVERVPMRQVREAVTGSMPGWLKQILADPGLISSAGYQSYIVLTLCRVLYTNEVGKVATKRTAADWARAMLHPRWEPLIERAWADRLAPPGPPDPQAADETLAMIRYALETLAGKE